MSGGSMDELARWLGMTPEDTEAALQRALDGTAPGMVAQFVTDDEVTITLYPATTGPWYVATDDPTP